MGIGLVLQKYKAAFEAFYDVYVKIRIKVKPSDDQNHISSLQKIGIAKPTLIRNTRMTILLNKSVFLMQT